MAEKKKPADSKKTTAGKKPVNKTVSAKGSADKKAAPKKTQKRTGKRQKSSYPAYVLTIMLLLTVILVLVNNIYFNDEKILPGRESKINSREKVSVKNTENPEVKKDTSQTDKKKDADKTADNADKKIRARVYFVKFNENTEHSYLSYVNRSVYEKNRVENAINELIKGLSRAEEQQGLLSAVPEGLKLRNVKINGSIAELDFDPSLQWGASGHILLNRIDQIVYTATQFDDVDSVIIKINGRTRKTLGGDGLSISGPLKRRVN